MRIFVLLLLFAAFSSAAFAQSRVSGKVFENKTYITVEGVKVENLKTHAVNTTDVTGAFSIAAKPGDILNFSSIGYKQDTVLITDMSVISVYLTPEENILKEVKVKELEFAKGTFALQPMLGPMGSKVVRYQTDKNGNPIGGLKMDLLSLFGNGKSASDKKMEQYTKDVKIAEAFNEKTLGPSLPITGQELTNFVVLYRPDAETFYDPNFNMTDYISACYKKFLQIPAEKRQSKDLVSLK